MIETKYYSQYGQDKAVLDILKFKTSGFFVDIGAHDGKELSNTYFMEKNLDWSGICVEPNPSVVNDLRNNRNCIIETRPISNQTGEVIRFYEHDEPMLSMTTGKGVSLQNPDGTIVKESASKQMKGISITDTLITHDAPKDIDYISMDVEGHEPDILLTFDFKRFNVKCWSIEWKNHGDGKIMYNNKFIIIETLLRNNYSVKQIEADIIAWR